MKSNEEGLVEQQLEAAAEVAEQSSLEESAEERSLFSIYGISVEHPMDWLLFFDPKRPFNRTTGFFRIEDYVPRKGANISLSINWEMTPCDNVTFAERYCENIAAQYRRQFKKNPYVIECADIVDFGQGKAAYLVSEHGANLGIVKKKSTEQVRILQLAFYDEHSGRAVVGSVIGHPEKIREKEAFFKELLFTIKCN